MKLVSFLMVTATVSGFSMHRGHKVRQAAIQQYKIIELRKNRIANHGHTILSSVSTSTNSGEEESKKLPPTVTPILLSVLALILSEGVALSTLPLYMQSLGASGALVGLSTSAFSIAQMLCCPLLVNLSSSIGRQKTLRLCLFGAACSSLVIAGATKIKILVFARFIAGVFAAAIPVAQAAVTDLVPPHQTAIALSQVSAASQTGLVIGPLASAFIQFFLISIGISSKHLVRGVFGASSAFAIIAVVVNFAMDNDQKDKNVSFGSQSNMKTVVAQAQSKSITTFPIQSVLRLMAVLASWALTLSVSTYSMYSSRFLGYAQPQLSAAMSLGAGTTILTQIFIVPRLVQRAGVHVSDTLGLFILSMGLAGTAVFRLQPVHSLFYLLIRLGTGIADTSTATLVAQYSNGREERGQNLGMIQSARAAARIFTPVISGSLFERSCNPGFPIPGSLPYLVNSALTFVLAPLPLLLKRLKLNENKTSN